MVKKNSVETVGSVQPAAVLQGVGAALAALILAAAGLAVAVYFSLGEAAPRLLRSLAQLAFFIGAFWAGRRCERRAWLHGILVGVVLFLLLGLLGPGSPPLVSWLWWRKLVPLTLLGMVGGIVGGLVKSS